MIKVIVKNNEITIKGHALYNNFGQDIVCASASSIIITSINAALRIDKDSLFYEEKKGYVRIIVKSEEQVIKSIMENMIAMLSELEETYKKNVKIVKEEQV